MATLTAPNVGLKHNWDLGTFYKAEMDTNLRQLDTVVQLSVLDKDLSTEPGGPTEGDRYIVNPTGLSAWAGQDNNIAVFIDANAGAAWEFITPQIGWACFVVDDASWYRFNGTTWVAAQGSFPIVDLATTGATPIDLTTGRDFRTPGATGNVTLSFTNIPSGVKTRVYYTWGQDAVGSHTLTFPAGTLWPGGVAPTPSSGANEIDEYFFDIDDAGVPHGNVIGQAYA